MHGNNFNVKLFGSNLLVKNVKIEMIPNCLIEVRNIFGQAVIFESTDFGPNEEKMFHITHDNFVNEWLNEDLQLEIYSNNKKIYRKIINTKKKCYVIYSNSNFERLAEQLIIGLTAYSTYDILHYTINYESTLNYPNLKNIEYFIDGDIHGEQRMQFIKPKIFLNVIDIGYESAVFLDADIQVRPNIDDLFNYVEHIKDGPILNKCVWDYPIVNGLLLPGPLLSDFMGITNNKYPYGMTNLVIFNKNHKSLFEEWESICFSNEIDELRKTEFLHDELIFNCLLWKNNIKPKEFSFILNVSSLEDVDFFYNHNIIYEDRINMNDFGFGHAFQSFIPHGDDKIKGFHYIKDITVASRINEYVYKNDKLV